MGQGDSNSLSQELLLSVAEELKLPLLQIARQAELKNSDLGLIQTTADTALRLIDNYVLGVRLAAQTEKLDTEAVSVSSVLYDAGHQLDAMAKAYGVDLQLGISGKFTPVTANRQGLQAALVSLGASLIESLPAQESPQLKLTMATHRSRYGIVAGMYADTKQLSKDALNKGRRLQKTSRQPLLNVSHTSGAGVFVADTILKAMGLHLIASRHHRLYGLGTVLKSNSQLHLV
jgi:hypothetical protein